MPVPPVAPKKPKVDVLHGDRRQDDYFWLRQKDDPEVLAYLRAENAYTEALTKPTEGFQAALYTEMLARIKEDDWTVPFRRGRHFYYSRTEKGKQYPMVTYIYERLTQGHNQYGRPSANGFSRQAYTSNGYAVLQPDIKYYVNDPGMSAVWALVPAVGRNGNAAPLQTFAELLQGIGRDGSRAHTLQQACVP